MKINFPITLFLRKLRKFSFEYVEWNKYLDCTLFTLAASVPLTIIFTSDLIGFILNVRFNSFKQVLIFVFSEERIIFLQPLYFNALFGFNFF